MTIQLKQVIISFESNKPFHENVHQLRGFFATQFNEFMYLHQHNHDKFLYQYPLVQYKMINKKPYVVGIQEGGELLKYIFDQFTEITLGNTVYSIVEKEIKIKTVSFGLSNELITYSFLTPWYGLNRFNYKKFYQLPSWENRHAFLEHTLIGNILSMSKSLKYQVLKKIECQLFTHMIKTEAKNYQIIGFLGHFTTNFIIPEYLGLGKSVSRGFGTIQQITI